MATGAISLSIPYWKIRHAAASGSVRKGVFSDIRLPTAVLSGLMLSTIIPSSHWHWMAVGSCWWVRTTVCMYIRKENLCCTWSTTPEICNHSPIISSGPSLPTGNITSGWARITEFPCHGIIMRCVISLFHKSPGRERGTSSIPCFAIHTEPTGLAEPTD